MPSNAVERGVGMQIHFFASTTDLRSENKSSQRTARYRLRPTQRAVCTKIRPTNNNKSPMLIFVYVIREHVPPRTVHGRRIFDSNGRRWHIASPILSHTRHQPIYGDNVSTRSSTRGIPLFLGMPRGITLRTANYLRTNVIASTRHAGIARRQGTKKGELRQPALTHRLLEA